MFKHVIIANCLCAVYFFPNWWFRSVWVLMAMKCFQTPGCHVVTPRYLQDNCVSKFSHLKPLLMWFSLLVILSSSSSPPPELVNFLAPDSFLLYSQPFISMFSTSLLAIIVFVISPCVEYTSSRIFLAACYFLIRWLKKKGNSYIYMCVCM